MVTDEHVDGRAGIDVALVRRLVATQFPQWAELPITPVRNDGWDNRTYHLGDDMAVRLPIDEYHSPQPEKEQHCLRFLEPRLPLPIPARLATGEPGEGYPFRWAINRWLDGETADPSRIRDLTEFATELGRFLVALRSLDPTDGPPAGHHSQQRGTPISVFDDWTRSNLASIGDRIDQDRVLRAWEAGLATTWSGPGVWFHGDVARGNLLVRDGRLAAVIDFGCCGVGDPACDLVIAWTFFSGESREAFRDTIGLDADTWARGRAWALWKSLLLLEDALDTGDPEAAAAERRLITELLDEHDRLS